MNQKDKVLTSQYLYERQKNVCQKVIKAAPNIICCDIKTPENIGSVLRVADAVGSRKVILLSDQDAVLEHKKIKKISRSSEDVVLESSNFEDYQSDVPLIAIELTELSSNIFDTKLPETCAFVMGNERYGIADKLLQQCESAVHIPMYGINGSMNVSHALAIVLYEWRRQYLS